METSSSSVKPPLKAASAWKGKSQNRKRAKNRKKARERSSKRQGYEPPRLQDLQFQNRLKAFRHFETRRDAASAADMTIYNTMNASLVGGSVPGFIAMPYNSSRVLTSDRLGDFTALGSSLAPSLAYSASGVTNFNLSKSGVISNTGRGITLPGNVHFGNQSYVNLPSGTSRKLNTTPAGDASTSGLASVSSGKARTSFKRHTRAFPHSRRPLAWTRNHDVAPAAPRNTTSFLMRAKKSGGIAPLVSPSPATPAVIPTPVISPFTTLEGPADEANNEWGVNGYGSMSGLISLRPLEFGLEYGDSESEVEQGVESVQQLEQRLDHDVSRFVMNYPTSVVQDRSQNILETQMDDQDSHIAHLEEENMDLKERLYSMQQEVEDLRKRLRLLEGVNSGHDAEAEASSGRSIAEESCL